MFNLYGKIGNTAKNDSQFFNLIYIFIIATGKEIHFKLPTELVAGVEYNINIYSEVRLQDSWYESNPLHLKLKKLAEQQTTPEDKEPGDEGAKERKQFSILL